MGANSIHSRLRQVGMLTALCAQLALPQGQTTGTGTGTGTTGGGGATTGGGTTGAGTTGTGTGNSRNTTSIPTTTTPQPQQFPVDIPRPIFLSGKVVLDDGTPPPETVVIERICNGNPRPEAYTDSRGRFQFQLGQNTAMMADASVGNMGDFGSMGGNSRSQSGLGGMGGGFGGRGISERDLMGCEIRASLAGYRSESVSLANRRSMDNPDIGTIILRRMANVEGLTFSATSALAPKDAKKAFEKGRDLARKKKFPDAQKELLKAVELYPKFANAWTDLGLVYEAQKNSEEARKAFEHAITADPKLVQPYVKLSMMYGTEKKWKECAETSGKAVKLNPFDYPEAYFYSAVANLNLQNLDDAEKSAREGIKADPRKRLPKMRHVLGIVLAQKNEVPAAMESMKEYMAMLPQGSPDISLVKGQLAQLEKFAQANQPKPAEAQQQQ
ncbi:MAG: tetratricopeptide repeat protein [Acidobacteria bacterium]|nr:tetratricopeptide repeat protein [Acidobacteriota bacterium]